MSEDKKRQVVEEHEIIKEGYTPPPSPPPKPKPTESGQDKDQNKDN